MSEDNDVIMSTNANAVAIKKDGSDTTLLKLSNTYTSLGNGAFSTGLNSISIGCSAMSNEIAPTSDTTNIQGKLSITNIRESGENLPVSSPNYVLMYNPSGTSQEATYSNTIPLHLDPIDASLNTYDASLNILDNSFNILETSFNVLDVSFNLEKNNVDISLNIHDNSLNTLDVSFDNLFVDFNYLDTSFNLYKPIVDTSLNIHDNSLNVLESNYNNLYEKQTTYDVSYNFLINQTPPSYGSTFSIGNGSIASGVNSFAIGPNASTGAYDNSVAIGNGTIAGADNRIFLGNSNQSVVTNEAIVHQLHFGDVYSADFSGFQHSVFKGTTNNYAMLQNKDGITFVNASSGKNVGFRIDNSEKINVDSTRTYFPQKIISTYQPMWTIFSNSGGDQSYGANGRIGSTGFLGGKTLVRYFNTINKWNTTHNGWNSTNGAFYAYEGTGIYTLDLYIFTRNAKTYNGRIRLATNAPRSQEQYEMNVCRKTSNDNGALLSWTWYANANQYAYFYVQTGTLNLYHYQGHTQLNIVKVA